MGMLERTDQILKWNMEDTGTASRTQKEKRHQLCSGISFGGGKHILSKERRAPNNIQQWGPVFNSRLHHHQKRETK